MKFSLAELNLALKLHTSNIYKWATDNSEASCVRDQTRETLLNEAARIYELIEELPEAHRTVKGH